MKPINEQINPNILIQAKKLTQFMQLLQNILPIECRNHVQVANIRNQNLMLITDSPVWTTRLRQLSPQILQYIQENTSSNKKTEIIHHIQISTRYHSTTSSAQTGIPEKNLNKPMSSTLPPLKRLQRVHLLNHSMIPMRKPKLRIKDLF